MFYRPFTAKAMRVVPLVIALMAIAVLVLPGNSVQAQQAGTVQYNENDDVPVITLTATDPEGASPILWSLLEDHGGAQDIPGEDGTDNVNVGDFEDHAMFKISANGVIEFKNKPDFEKPADTVAGNEYRVVVQASDGSTMNWFKLTVNVMDVEEEGSVKLRPGIEGGQPELQAEATLLQPQVGVGITATDLMDSDVIIAETPEYKWYRTSSRTATGTEIDGATTTTYPPDRRGRQQRRRNVSPCCCHLHRRRPVARQQDRHGGFGLRNDEQDLQQRTPDVPFGNYYESGARGNPKGDGHRHPNHGHRRGQRREIDLLADQ